MGPEMVRSAVEAPSIDFPENYAYAVLVVNGAGWHIASRLVLPHNVGLLKQPPYVPELNPSGNVWAYLFGNVLSNVVHDSYETVVSACCKAWTWPLATPDRVRSIAAPEWAQVNV